VLVLTPLVIREFLHVVTDARRFQYDAARGVIG